MIRVRVCSLILSFLILGCKVAVPPESELQAEEQLTADQGRLVFPKPVVTFSGPALPPERLLAKVPGLYDNLSEYELTTSMTPEGESVLWAKLGPEDFMPVLSQDAQREVWVWDQAVLVAASDDPGSIAMLPTTKVFKRALRQRTDEPADAIPYLLFPSSQGAPRLAGFVDTINHAEATIYRVGNDFINSAQEALFSFKALEAHVWRLEGQFHGPLICSGSVVWHDQNSRAWYALTRRFNLVQQSSWREDGGTLVFNRLVDLTPEGQRHLNSVRPCSLQGNEAAAGWIASLEYDPLAEVYERVGESRPFKWGQDYPLGTRIEFDDALWLVLESRPQLGFYRVLNHSRVPAADRGRQNQRVYEIRWVADPDVWERFSERGARKLAIEEFGLVRDFVLAAAEAMNELSNDRLRVAELSRKLGEVASIKMRIAETKVNTVGAGWEEWYKPAVNILANVAMDRMLDANFAARGAKLFGLQATGRSIAGAVVGTGVPFKNRLAAFFVYSAVEGVSYAAIPMVINLERSKPDQAAQALWQSLASTGVIWGMRSAGALLPGDARTTSVMVASGVVMRWRTIRLQEAMGYVNLNQSLNLAVGGLQAYLQVKAINSGMSPGKVRALMRAGVLVSEVISGRGYPGVMLGSLVEIGADLLVMHPAIRPFSNTLAGQVSALIQLGDAHSSLKQHGAQLDHARELRLSQASLYNSVAFLLKTQEGLLDQQRFIDQETIITVMTDPFRVIREHYTP